MGFLVKNTKLDVTFVGGFKIETEALEELDHFVDVFLWVARDVKMIPSGTDQPIGCNTLFYFTHASLHRLPMLIKTRSLFLNQLSQIRKRCVGLVGRRFLRIKRLLRGTWGSERIRQIGKDFFTLGSESNPKRLHFSFQLVVGTVFFPRLQFRPKL